MKKPKNRLKSVGRNMVLIRKLKLLLEMIKFEHTIFALPFAYLGMILGAKGLPDLTTFILITLAMVGARTYAMALNRLFDLDIDKKNPRTKDRALPKKTVTKTEAIILTLAALLLFFAAVYLLPPLCLKLWPAVIIPMTFYSLAKRFTWLCHFLLGMCLGLAPFGSWVAVTGTMPNTGIYLLGLAVMFWTAGFDIIYSCQDHAFDRKQKLHSAPVRFGIKSSLSMTKALHTLTVILLILCGISFSLGMIYYLGIAIVAVFLFYENTIISENDMSRVNAAFFTANGFVSIIAFVFTWIAVCLRA
jgi:4-hydroxybenzoate polyprenyltransferase